MTVDFRALCTELAKLARRDHYRCEDHWYSCPKSPDGCANDSAGDECNCGAGSHNDKIDELLSLIALATLPPEPMDDDDCISPQDLHDIACSLSEGRKGLRKHIVYFQDEGKDKGIGVWAKNEEEAEILAMEKYCQLKKARAT